MMIKDLYSPDHYSLLDLNNNEDVQDHIVDLLIRSTSVGLLTDANNYFSSKESPYGLRENFNDFDYESEDDIWGRPVSCLINNNSLEIEVIILPAFFKTRSYELAFSLKGKSFQCIDIGYRGKNFTPSMEFTKGYKDASITQVLGMKQKIGIIKFNSVPVKENKRLEKKENNFPKTKDIVQISINEKSELESANEYIDYVIRNYEQLPKKNLLFSIGSFKFTNYKIQELILSYDKNESLDEVKFKLDYLAITYGKNDESYFIYEPDGMGYRNFPYARYEKKYQMNSVTCTFNIYSALEDYFQNLLEKIKLPNDKEKKEETLPKEEEEYRILNLKFFISNAVCGYIRYVLENCEELEENGKEFAFNPHYLGLGNYKFEEIEVGYDPKKKLDKADFDITYIVISENGHNHIFDMYDEEHDYYQKREGKYVKRNEGDIIGLGEEYKAIDDYFSDALENLKKVPLYKTKEEKVIYRSENTIIKENEDVSKNNEVNTETMELKPEEEEIRQDKINEFLILCNNAGDGNYDDVLTFYNEILNKKEKENQEVKEYFEVIKNDYLNYLMEPDLQSAMESKKEPLRKVFCSASFYAHLSEYAKNDPSIEKEVEGIISHLVHDSYRELCEFFVSRRINKTYNYKKIRINNAKLARIIFYWGKDFDKSYNKEAKAVYLVDFLPNDDHEYDFLKDKDYSNESYRMEYNSVLLYEPTSEQKKFIENDAYPFLCLGVAGAGKTTVSVYKYQQIINNYFTDGKSVDIHQLVFLTFNDYVRENALNQLECLGIKANAETIDSFFKIVLGMNDISVQTLNDFTLWLNDIYLSSKDNKKLKFIKTILKKKEYVNFVYTYYRGVYKGCMLEWKREDIISPLTRKQFEDNLSQSGKDDYLSQEDKDALYDACKEYHEYLKKNKLKDENDLSGLVINKIKNNGIRKFDHIIIDEVQDLTELQLYALIMCSEDYKLYFFGDQNQIINPTIFDVNKIKGALMSVTNNKNMTIKNEMKDIELNKTFRSGPLLVRYINNLIDIRKKYLGSSQFDDPIEAYYKDAKDKYWARYIVDEALIKYALDASLTNSKCAILVNNEEQKRLLNEKYPDLELTIFTIYEAKGLEWETVLLYNFLSYEKEYYEEILSQGFKCSLIHKMIFNRYYVACTRAVKTFLVIEENLPDNIKNSLLDGMDKITRKSSISTFISKSENYEDWLETGKEYFERGLYRQAKQMFDKAYSFTKEKEKVQSWMNNNDYMLNLTLGKIGPDAKQAEKFFISKNFRQALTIYEKLKDKEMVLSCKVMMKEYLSEEEIIYLLNSKEISNDVISALMNSNQIIHLLEETKARRERIFGKR